MITIIPYQKQYERQVQSLYEIPVSGDISLSLQRKPDSALGAHIQTEFPEVFIAVVAETDTVAGIFNLGTRSCFWEGEKRLIPYYCDLRIHPDYQNSKLFYKILQFIRGREIELNQLPASTIVFADNHRMLEMIRKRANGKLKLLAPYYQKIADLSTFIFKRCPDNFGNHAYDIRRAVPDDIEKMKALCQQVRRELMLAVDFGDVGRKPYYHGQQIEDYILCFSGDQLLGMMAEWDTSRFKQTVVHSYSALYGFFRPLYNLIAAHLLSFPSLPPVGGHLGSKSIHCVAILDRDPAVFRALLDFLTKSGGSTYMFTLDKADPLYMTMNSIRRFIRKEGYFYLVTGGNRFNKSFDWIPIDVARI